MRRTLDITTGWAALLAAALGCGGEPAPTAEPDPVAASAEPEAVAAAEPTEPEPTAPEPTEPEPTAPEPVSEPVDLLRAVGTELAVSSAYRDRESQVPRLFDGDLETAWNSSSGDLVGAWIEVRLPEAATVTEIRMTAGFTKRTDDRDLFTGNHRVARVRVLRDGEEVAAHALDPSSRQLQTIPAAGPGGVWRIEVAETVPGERDDWREVCISELEVLGRAPDSGEGRFPRYAIGALPEPESPAAPPADFAAALRFRTHQLTDAWIALEGDMMDSHHSFGDPGMTQDEAAEFRQRRRALLGQLRDLVAPIDPALRDRARRAREAPPAPRGDGSVWPAYAADVALLHDVMSAAAEHQGDDAARCRWAQAHARVRLHRVAKLVAVERERDDMDAAYGGAGALGQDLSELADVLRGLARDYSRDPRTHTRRLLRMSEPDAADVHDDWAALRGQLEAAQRTCGWTG